MSRGRWKWKARGGRVWAKNKEADSLAATEKRGYKDGHVYIMDIGIDNLFKIGRTWSIQQRMKALKASNPDIVCIWSAYVPDASDTEKKLHEIFKKHRVERELFRLPPDAIKIANSFINSIR